MDFFQSKWKTTNRKKEARAIAYVERVTDQELLKTIALEAPLDAVAEVAINKIGDLELLRKIALEYKDHRSETAALKISDQEILAEIIMSANNLWSKVAAAERIRDSEIAHNLLQKNLHCDILNPMIHLIKDKQLAERLLKQSSNSLYAWKLRDQIEKLDKEKQHDNMAVAKSLYSHMQQNQTQSFLALVCPNCGGDIVALEDGEYSDHYTDAWHYVYWLKCENCNFFTNKSRSLHLEDAAMVVASQPSTGRLPICPLCRKRRMNDTDGKYIDGIGPKESCKCDVYIKMQYAPINIELWDYADYKRQKMNER